VRSTVAESNTRSVKKRNYGCRITERVSLGQLATVVIENEKLRIMVLAGRGADVIEFLYKPRDMDFVWLSSTGVRGNTLDPYPKDDEASFIDEYPGGWQTIFPNGGAPSEYRGILLGQHAEVAILPWDYEILQDTPERSSVKFMVTTRKFPYMVEKTFSIDSDSARCEIQERIVNLSAQTLEAMWGTHFTFGPPFLGENSRITVSDHANVIPHNYLGLDIKRRVGNVDNFSWPKGKGPHGEEINFSELPVVGTPGEMLYLKNFPTGRYRVETPSKKLAAEVTWDCTLFPYLWYWQEYGFSLDAPWFGKHYNIGLEPFSSYPTRGLAESVANDSAITFSPHEEKVQRLSFGVSEM
jgi:hypothetical protein